MTRLDWEKVRRESKVGGRRRPRGVPAKRVDKQIEMAMFVKQHELACFKCKRNDIFEWAKTGFSKRGPWAICGQCVKKR